MIATAVEHMLAAGMDHAAIVEAIRAMEAEIAPKRSAGAIRQERYRRNKASQSVTSDAPPSFPETKVSPTPPSKTQTLSPPHPPITPPLPEKPFDLFWRAYPTKVQKRSAMTAFDRALKRAGGVEPILAGIDAAKRQSRQWREGFIPHPSTWLNADGWLDEHGPPDLKVVATPSRAYTDAEQAEHLASYQKGGPWNRDWGERPTGISRMFTA